MASSRGGTPLPVARARRARSAKTAEMIPRETGDTESVMGELGGKAARVELYRREGVEFAYVDTLGGDSVDKEVIKQTYGAGKYQARIYEPGADSDPQLVDFAIAAPNVTTPVRNDNDPIMRMMTALLEKLDRIAAPAPQPDRGMEMVARALEKLATPRDDNKLMETFMINVLPSLIESRGKGGNGDGVSTLEVLKMLQNERENGIQLGERMAVSTDGNSMAAVASVVRDVGVPLASAISERMKREDAGKQPARVLPATTGAVNAAPVHNPAQMEIPVVSHAIPKWLAAAVPFESVVVNWAKTDADVGKKAVWLLESLDDEEFGQVGATMALDDDDVLTLVNEALPALGGYREWTMRLIGALRAAHISMTEDAVEGDV